MKDLVNITLLGLYSCTGIWAQGTAQIHGTVQDTSDAAIADATVESTRDAGIPRIMQFAFKYSSNLGMGDLK